MLVLLRVVVDNMLGLALTEKCLEVWAAREEGRNANLQRGRVRNTIVNIFCLEECFWLLFISSRWDAGLQLQGDRALVCHCPVISRDFLFEQYKEVKCSK